MLEFISIVTSIAGLFTLLDLFIEKNAKAKISEYVFGFGTADLSSFEHNVIQALLSRLRVDGRISFKRVLFRYSMVIAAILTFVGFMLEFVFQYDWIIDEEESFPLRLAEILAGFPLGIALFWPFDCWSLWVTNKIFGGNRSGSVLIFLGRTLLDITVTVLPLILIFGIAGYIAIKTGDPDGGFTFYIVIIFAVFSMVNLFGSLLITMAQLLTLFVGMLLRFFLRVTRLNQGLAMVSRAHEFPFTFIGLITSLSAASLVTFT